MYDRYQFPDAKFAPSGFTNAGMHKQKRPPEGPSGGLGNVLSRLSSLFQGSLETEDLLLIGLLILLYMDSKDEDFLIFLAVVVLSMLQKE